MCRRVRTDSWVQRNIFEQEQIIIPYYWKGARHFMCAIIDCREEVISVYDSLHDKRRASALHKVRKTAS